MIRFFIKIKNKILTVFFMLVAYLCFRLKIEYVNPDQKKNPPNGIYICNHMEIFDGFVIRTVLKRLKVYSLVTTKWYEKSWARELLFFENCIPVDIENPGTSWLKECRKILKRGDSISIFPEGHTSKSENVNEFKPGFLLLASFEKGIPIIPIATTGCYKFFFGDRKRVLVGQPVYFEDLKIEVNDQGLKKGAEYFHNLIVDMKKQLNKNLE